MGSTYFCRQVLQKLYNQKNFSLSSYSDNSILGNNVSISADSAVAAEIGRVTVPLRWLPRVFALYQSIAFKLFLLPHFT